MNCDACKCKINRTYELTNASCDSCGESKPDCHGTYMGMGSSNQHVFRLHPRQVCECGAYLWYVHVPCEDGLGIDVTEEFRSLINARG